MFPRKLFAKYKVLHLLLDCWRHLAQVDFSPAGFEILFGEPLLWKPGGQTDLDDGQSENDNFVKLTFPPAPRTRGNECCRSRRVSVI